MAIDWEAGFVCEQSLALEHDNANSTVTLHADAHLFISLFENIVWM